jgi:hypothetical protein
LLYQVESAKIDEVWSSVDIKRIKEELDAYSLPSIKIDIENQD